MNRCLVPFLLVLMLGCPGAIVGDEGDDFLDESQAQVEEIAKLAIANYNARCDLLATCNNVKNCSHGVCEPLLGERERLTCKPVINSTYCPAINNSPCKSMNLDYTKGYVRLARSTSRSSVNTMLSTCAHRQLDPLLQTWAQPNSTVFTRSYFGTLEGMWRVLPGSARSETDCNSYDLRSRPWFRTSTSVMKVVIVLIDLASSMNGNLPPGNGGGTKLQAAKNIVRQLMTTLSAGDHVNFIVFNSTGAYQLSPDPILVKEHDDTEQFELQPLLNELEGLDVESQYKQSNITAAILAALPNFDSNPLAAKAILVLTDAVFTTFAKVAIPAAAGAKVFLYQLPQSNDVDVALAINSSLIPQLCAIGGHYEVIVRDLENPLLAINKFFSYFANLKQIETNGMPQYSDIYQDFERIGGNLTSVTKLAFNANGDLIGVAGVSIYLELLGNRTNPVKDALRRRVTGYGYPTKSILLTSANCTSFPNGTAQACAGGYVKNGGLCEKTDTKSSIEDLACCGECSTHGPSPHSTLNKGVIAAIVIVSFLGTVGVVLFLVCAYRRFRIGRQNRGGGHRPPPIGDAPRDPAAPGNQGPTEVMLPNLRQQASVGG